MTLTAQMPGLAQVRPLRQAKADRTEPASAQATGRELWERHGGEAYTLACALLGEEHAAAEAVRLAMADLVQERSGPSTEEVRRRLTRHVFRHAQRSTGVAGPAAPATGAGRLPRPMVWLSGMARLQRTSLALCVYGGLTHRAAAALLDVPPAAVAELITAGLRELNRLAAAESATCA